MFSIIGWDIQIKEGIWIVNIFAHDLAFKKARTTSFPFRKCSAYGLTNHAYYFYAQVLVHFNWPLVDIWYFCSEFGGNRLSISLYHATYTQTASRASKHFVKKPFWDQGTPKWTNLYLDIYFLSLNVAYLYHSLCEKVQQQLNHICTDGIWAITFIKVRFKQYFKQI